MDTKRAFLATGVALMCLTATATASASTVADSSGGGSMQGPVSDMLVISDSQTGSVVFAGAIPENPGKGGGESPIRSPFLALPAGFSGLSQGVVMTEDGSTSDLVAAQVRNRGGKAYAQFSLVSIGDRGTLTTPASFPANPASISENGTLQDVTTSLFPTPAGATAPYRVQVYSTGSASSGVAPVPIPPAVLLFGSGLVGLALIGRPRRAGARAAI